MTSTTMPIVTFSISPNSHATPYEMSRGDTPLLRWSVLTTDALSATVTGPNNFNQSGLAGGLQICPGTVAAGKCTAPSGSYTYNLVVKSSDGSVIASQSQTLNLTS